MSNHEVTLTGVLSVSDLENLAAAQAVQQAPPEAEVASSDSNTDAQAVVTLIAPGKRGSDASLVEPGTTVAMLLNSAGWEYDNTTQFRLITEGSHGSLNLPNDQFRIPAGVHTLFVQRKVVGG